MSNRLLVASMLAIGTAVPATALAAEADHPPALMAIVTSIDHIPTIDSVRDAGAGTDGSALIAIATDRTLPRYPRARATALLAFFDSRAAREGLHRLVSSPAFVDREVKIQAVAALTYLDPGRALPLLEKVVLHENVHLRAAAVRALSRLEQPRARRLLVDRLIGEPDASVRRLIVRRLRDR